MASHSSPKIRVAVIGAGLIGPRHASTVAQNNDTELVAIVDPLPSTDALATELGTTRFGSVADLVQSSQRPDAVIICTPNHTHVAIAKQLVSEGIHVLVEKPVGTDIPSGQELQKLLEGTEVKALVGHHRRFNPYMVAAKALVDSGSLGNIIAINGLWTQCKPLDYFDPPADWRREKTGGVVLINMIHEVDLLHYLFGPITRVHAEQTISQRGFDAEEGAALTLRFKSGIVGSFVVSDNAPSPYNFEAGTGENPLMPKTGESFYRIFGSDASLSVPDMTMWSYTGKERSWHNELVQNRIPVPEGVPFELQLQHFVRVIRGEEKPSCTVKAGLAALIVCQAMKEAIEANSTVEIEPYEL